MKKFWLSGFLIVFFISFGLDLHAFDTAWDGETLIWGVDGLRNVTLDHCELGAYGDTYQCTYEADYPSRFFDIYTIIAGG
jgi:hypothetical protein